MTRVSTVVLRFCAFLLCSPGTPARAGNWAYPQEVRAEVLRVESRIGPAGKRTATEVRERLRAAGLTPERRVLLYYAVGGNNVELFNELLGRPRMINVAELPAADETGKTALMYAAEIGQFWVVKRLVPLTDVEASRFTCAYGEQYYRKQCDRFGYTALMHAAAAGQTEVVNYLLNAGASPYEQCHVARYTALQLAQNGGHAMTAAAIQARLEQLGRARAEEQTRLRELESRSVAGRLRAAWEWIFVNTIGNQNLITILELFLGAQVLACLLGRQRKRYLIGLWLAEWQRLDPPSDADEREARDRRAQAFFRSIRWRRKFVNTWLPLGPPPTEKNVEVLAEQYREEFLETMKGAPVPATGTA